MFIQHHSHIAQAIAWLIVTLCTPYSLYTSPPLRAARATCQSYYIPSLLITRDFQQTNHFTHQLSGT